MKKIPWIVALVAFSHPAHAQIPAFPGAEGAGMWAEGGRGGKVIEVTNLDDSGPGSLREAVLTKEPRIVVFRTGGTVELASPLSVRDPRITIAGQTAPGGGIALKNHPLVIQTDHVIVRHLRVRPGDEAGEEVDALVVTEGSDIIVDHCSTSWSVDETLSVTGEDLDRVTIQWSIISESLHCSVHTKGCHGMGSLVRSGWGHQFTFHHNLYAHHNARSPRPGNYNDFTTDPDGLVFDFRNNLVYNWGGSAAGYNADENSITKLNVVANCYRPGPNSTGSLAYRESCPYAMGYFADNSMSGDVPADPWSLVSFSSAFSSDQIAAYQQTTPFPVAAVNTDTAAEACERVLDEAGATLPDRDAVDTRIVDDVRNGTGSIIDDEDEVGGWPALAQGTPPPDDDHDGMPNDFEIASGLDPNDPTDGNLDCDSDGYTNVEEYLNGGLNADACGSGGSSGSGGSGGTGGSAGSSGAGGTAASGGTGGQDAQAGVGGADGGAAGLGAPAVSGVGGSDATATSEGCGCRLAGRPRSPASTGWLLVIVAMTASWRRRKRVAAKIFRDA